MKEFKRGLRMAAPVCLGALPIGISYGLLAIQSGLEPWQAIFMSMLVMAGASQIMAVGMLAQGAAAVTIVIATFLINLRHLVMSSSVMNRLKKEKTGTKLLSAFALCDESFAMFSMTRDADIYFLLGANTALYGVWVAGSSLGCLASAFLPAIVAKSFGIAFYAAFIAMLLPEVRKNARLLALVVLTALLNWGLQWLLPSSWALVVAMVAGAVIGVFFIRDEEAQREDSPQADKELPRA